jgi:hypothetical protein
MQQPRLPSIEQVTRDREVVEPTADDQIQLPFEPDQIVVVSQVQIGQVRDQQVSDLGAERRVVSRERRIVRVALVAPLRCAVRITFAADDIRIAAAQARGRLRGLLRGTLSGRIRRIRTPHVTSSGYRSRPVRLSS